MGGFQHYTCSRNTVFCEHPIPYRFIDSNPPFLIPHSSFSFLPHHLSGASSAHHGLPCQAKCTECTSCRLQPIHHVATSGDTSCRATLGTSPHSSFCTACRAFPSSNGRLSRFSVYIITSLAMCISSSPSGLYIITTPVVHIITAPPCIVSPALPRISPACSSPCARMARWR